MSCPDGHDSPHDKCKWCKMATQKDTRYAWLWFGDGGKKPKPKAEPKDMVELPCIYRGEEMGREISCSKCTVFSCSLHGTCTKQRDFAPKHKCCRLCEDRRKE